MRFVVCYIIIPALCGSLVTYTLIRYEERRRVREQFRDESQGV